MFMCYSAMYQVAHTSTRESWTYCEFVVHIVPLLVSFWKCFDGLCCLRCLQPFCVGWYFSSLGAYSRKVQPRDHEVGLSSLRIHVARSYAIAASSHVSKKHQDLCICHRLGSMLVTSKGAYKTCTCTKLMCTTVFIQQPRQCNHNNTTEHSSDTTHHGHAHNNTHTHMYTHRQPFIYTIIRAHQDHQQHHQP